MKNGFTDFLRNVAMDILSDRITMMDGVISREVFQNRLKHYDSILKRIYKAMEQMEK